MRRTSRIPSESFALAGRFFALLTLLFVVVGYGHAQTPPAAAAAAPPAEGNFADICPDAAKGLFDGNRPADRAFRGSWQKDYPLLIFNMDKAIEKVTLQKAVATTQATADLDQKNYDKALPENQPQLLGPLNTAKASRDAAAAALADFRHDNPTSGQMYWRQSDTGVLTQLPNPTFIPSVYTTEKVLVLVCHSQYGDSADVNETAVAVNSGDNGTQSLRTAQLSGITMDRVFVLDPSKVTNNSLERVIFTAKLDPTANAPADTLATALIERHKIVHYSAGGGLLLIRGTQNSYSNVTVASTLSTVNSVNTTVTTNGVVTGTTSNITNSMAAGTFTNVFGQRGSAIQVTDVAGVTWYPFGRDTFPVTRHHGVAIPYAFYNPARSMGIFLGTSVSSLGNFTVGPTYEPFLGLQFYAGTTWWNKTTLQPGVTACSGYGNSPSFTVPPSSSNTTTQSSTASGVTTVTSTTTTITTTATSNCANGDRATIVSGSTSPTQSTLKPAFSFGILFNTNLTKYFSGLK